MRMRRAWLVACVCLAGVAHAQSPEQALVRAVVANELEAQSHPAAKWAYTLEKKNASGTKVTRIIETRDGLVGRLLEINGKPLDAITEKNEEHRLNELKRDPRQMRQKLSRQERDRDRVLKIVRALPNALIFSEQSHSGDEEVLAFRPNPTFQPQNFEESILKAMTGTVTIALAEKRLVALHGNLVSDVNIGLGIVGKVQKGGTLDLEQERVGDRSWEIRRLSLKVMGRAVFKHVDLSVEENVSDFQPVKEGMSAAEAIDILLQMPQGTGAK